MKDNGQELMKTGGLLAGALALGLLTAWFVLNVQKPDPDARSLQSIFRQESAQSPSH